MSKFLTTLRVMRVEDNSHDGRGTWELLNIFAYKSDVADTTFVVPKGFITDFASVPRVPVAFWLTGETAQKPAVIHDWLYTSHEVARSVADAVFREACLLTGMPAWRAWMMWLGVRAGGKAWDESGQRQTPHVVEELVEAEVDGLRDRI